MIVRDDAQELPFISIDTNIPSTIGSNKKSTWHELDYSHLNAKAVLLTVRGQIHKSGNDFSANPFILVDFCNKTNCDECVLNLGTGTYSAFKIYAASGNRGERETSSRWFPLNENGKLYWRWDWTPMENTSGCAIRIWLDAWQ